MTSNMSKREIYEKKISAQLDGWNADLDKLEAKLKEADADTRLKVREQMDKLESKRDTVKQKFKDLKSASDDAWSDVKDGFEGAWQAMSDSLESARKQFK